MHWQQTRVIGSMTAPADLVHSLQYAPLSGIPGGLSPGVKLELLQNVMDMVLDSLHLDMQLHSDLFVREFLLNERQDLAFPRSEMRQTRKLQAFPGVGALGDLGEQ